MTHEENHASLKKRQWYASNIQALHRNRPWVVPFIAGLFLLEVSSILALPWRLVSIGALWVAQCLLVFAAARWLHQAGWIRKRKALTTLLWVLNAAISATLATSALDRYRAYRDPNSWLLLKSRPINSVNAPLLTGDGYYLLDLSPESDLRPKKAALEESRNELQKLESQAKLSGEDSFHYAMVSRFTNIGPRRLLIDLPLRISYEDISDKHLPVPSSRQVQIAIQALNPGESFKVIIFSTDPERYSSFTFPDSVSARWDDTGEVHHLLINYEGDDRLYRALAQNIVVSGVRVAPSPTPEPSHPVGP